MRGEEKKWSDDPSYIESALLNKYLLKGKDYQHTRKATYPSKIDEKAEKVWFCWEYQRNKCSHKSSHLKVVKGEQRLAMHICASCWLKDKKKLEHPESSTACPHLAACLQSGINAGKNIISDHHKKLINIFFPKFCEIGSTEKSKENVFLKQNVNKTECICKHSSRCNICVNTQKHINQKTIDYFWMHMRKY